MQISESSAGIEWIPQRKQFLSLECGREFFLIFSSLNSPPSKEIQLLMYDDVQYIQYSTVHTVKE